MFVPGGTIHSRVSSDSLASSEVEVPIKKDG